MWRPDGWKNPYVDEYDSQPHRAIVYEAGADAMLEALKKQHRVKYLNYEIPNPDFPFPATYYLIPNER